MVDETEGKRVAGECLNLSREFWGIDPAWRIWLQFKGLDEGTAAICDAEVDYRKAYLTVDLNQVETLETLWRHVAHETIHVVLVDMELYPLVAQFGRKHNPALSRVFTFGIERTTCALEAVFARERPFEKYGDLEVTKGGEDA